MIIGCLQSLIENYPVIVREIKREVISTKLVEDFFFMMRDIVVTPDTLEFAVSFSSGCTERVKKKLFRILILLLNALKDWCIFRQLSKCQKSKK